MLTEKGLYIGKGTHENILIPRMANRHGLIAGATGTGKTVTLKVLAESFSDLGVPVFLADIKGDLSGTMLPGTESEGLKNRLSSLGIDTFAYQGYPCEYWDVLAERGIPVRTTISEIGPLLLSRILDLNETQESILSIVFQYADDNQLLLLDFKDLKELIAYVSDHTDDLKADYGNIPSASIGTIQRRLIAFEADGLADIFFGEEALDIRDFMKVATDGRGIINILRAEKLYQQPKLYASFLLWLLSELFEELPEVGDLEQPKLVFFFDEAHLLFTNAPKALLEKIEQVVRLIRSKGVGIYFISQSPEDIPDTILGQLGNRIQHALRAYTPRDQKAIRAAAQSFRSDGTVNVEEAITQLKVGQALISFLDEEGRPTVVDMAMILPPMSHMGPAEENDVENTYKSSSHFGKYSDIVDRESAFEILRVKVEKEAAAEEQAKLDAIAAKEAEKQAKEEAKAAEKLAKEQEKEAKAAERAAQKAEENSITNQILKSVTRTATSTIGRQITNSLIRGLLGSLKK